MQITFKDTQIYLTKNRWLQLSVNGLILTGRHNVSINTIYNKFWHGLLSRFKKTFGDASNLQTCDKNKPNKPGSCENFAAPLRLPVPVSHWAD